jgi:hypothetical protein
MHSYNKGTRPQNNKFPQQCNKGATKSKISHRSNGNLSRTARYDKMTRHQNSTIAQPVHHKINPANVSHDLVAPPRNSFTAIHLSETLQRIAKSDPFSKLKPYQLDILYSPIPNLHGNEKALIHFLRQWFDIFNSAFYDGALRTMRDRLYLVTDEAGSDKGIFWLHTPLDKSQIWIRKNYVPLSFEKITQEESFLGTLVHEMLHAFLRFYTCDCKPCKNLEHPSVGGFGTTGHGPCWIDPMLAIGQALQNAVQWRVQVGVIPSIKYEMRESNWEPTMQEIRRWDITPTRFSDGELSTYGWLKNSRQKEWELQRPDRDELIRRRKEEEDKRDKDVSDKTHDMIGWYLFEDGRQKDQPHPSIWEQDERRIEKEMRDVARKYIAERGGKEKYLQMKLQEWGEKAREKEKKEQERARDRRRLGTTNTSTSREEEEHRRRRRAQKEQRRQEKERNEQERKRREEKEIPGKLQEWLEQQQQSIEQTPEMNPKKEQLAPRYPGLPPMPPSARRRSANGSSGPRRASTADSPPRRADDPEVANERSMRRKIKETSRKLWNWRR